MTGCPESLSRRRRTRTRVALWAACAGLLSTAAPPTAAQGESAIEIYKRLVVHQASADPLIGVWYGVQCGKEIVVAVVLNDRPGAASEDYSLKKIVLNGHALGKGYRDADVVGYLSPLAADGAYQGVASYMNKAGDKWLPQRAVLTDPNVLRIYDDVGKGRACADGNNVFLRSRPVAEAEPARKAQRTVGTGSGFLLRKTSLVMTAQHVVADATRISVRFPSGQVYNARVAAEDERNDLAVLELIGFEPGDKGLTVDPMAPVRPGQFVSALGYPRVGTLGARPSIVSGDINADVGLGGRPTEFRTSVPVNPGNSGGPILSADGRVIGVVVSAAADGSEAVHFAVKMTTALSLLQHVGWRAEPSESAETLSPEQLFLRYADAVPLILVEAMVDPG